MNRWKTVMYRAHFWFSAALQPLKMAMKIMLEWQSLCGDIIFRQKRGFSERVFMQQVPKKEDAT